MKSADNIKRSLLLLMLFPSVTFNLLPTEIFPYALLLVAYLNSSFIYVFLAGSILGLTGNLVWTSLTFVDFVASWGALTNATIPIFLTRRILYSFALKVFHLYFWIVIVLCFMQWSNLFYFLQPIIEAMIPRGSMIGLGGSRGVTALSSEPSRAAYEFCMVSYVILLSLWHQNANRKLFIYSVFCILFLIMNKSLTGIILYVICFSFFLLHVRAFKSVIYLVLATFILALFSSYIDLLPDRITQLILLALGMDFTGLFEFLTYQSYHRFDVYVKSLDFIFTYFHGVGFGNWSLAQTISTHPSPHIERVPYLLQLAVEVGFFPMIILLFFLVYKSARAKNLMLVTPQLIALLLVADPGSPVVTFCLAVTIVAFEKKNAN